jgi:hypothetical protein
MAVENAEAISELVVPGLSAFTLVVLPEALAILLTSALRQPT